MIFEKTPNLWLGVLLLFSGVFFFCCKSASYMPLGLVGFQNAFHLPVQPGIHVFQPFGHIFMYGAFAYAKLAGSAAHGGLVLHNIRPQLHRPVFHNAFHTTPPVFFVQCMLTGGGIDIRLRIDSRKQWEYNAGKGWFYGG